MWLVLAFLSAALLGCYDSFKKQALRANAVVPVLFLNTLFSSLFFLPFIILSATTNTLDGSIFHVASGGWEVLQLAVGLFRHEASAVDHRRTYQCHASRHGAGWCSAGVW